MYGAMLAREISALDLNMGFIGMGGPGMRAAGVETVVDANEMAVVGLVEVVAHFPVIVKAFNTLKNILLSDPPDLLILIDYPDFNLRLAKVAKRAGVKVLHFISPQVWAWRAGRVKKIGRVIDHMAVLFSFEVPYYERENVPVTFVGHPLLDMVRPTMAKGEAMARFGLVEGRKVIGLFPGSRRSEIKSLLPVILDAARLLKDRHPEVQFVLPLASSLKREQLQSAIDASGLEISVVANATHDVIQVCDAIITVSGTVTMEIAILGVPMVIIYKVSPFTYAVGKRLIKVDHIGICNIVAGDRVVRELIQHDAEPEKISAEIAAILEDAEYSSRIRSDLAAIPAKLGDGGALRRVAQLALSLINEKEAR